MSMAIAEAVLTVIEDEGLQDHARSVGEYLLHQLLQLQTKFPAHIGDVRYEVLVYLKIDHEHHCMFYRFRGVGFFIGLDLVKNRDSREPHPQLATKIINRSVPLSYTLHLPSKQYLFQDVTQA